MAGKIGCYVDGRYVGVAPTLESAKGRCRIAAFGGQAGRRAKATDTE
jgi:hypothetical protein